MKAKAVVFEDVGKAVFRDVDVPEPGPRDAVIRTKYSLISNGTEGSFLRGERVEGEVASKPGGKLPFPQVPGYQKVGVVERPPEEGLGLSEGQWVFATVSKVGLPESPMARPFGGHVEVAVTDVDEVYPLPEGLDPVEASGLVLTQVGYNCGSRPPVGSGDRAVVIGDGLVGQWAAQTLRHRGAATVLVGKHRHRCEKFKAGPDDQVISLTEVESLAGALREACPEGISILVDTVGANDVVVDLFEQFRPESHLVSAGFLGEGGAIDIQMLRRRETTLHCPSGWERSRLEETVELVAAGALRVSPLITHRMPAEHAPRAFEMILRKEEEFLGILLEWE